MIDTYIKKIASITKRGDAREESYYSALAALLEEFSEEVAHYARVITAIAETVSIQQFLDDLFAQVERSLLEVRL
jgi:hypothetical protein